MHTIFAKILALLVGRKPNFQQPHPQHPQPSRLPLHLTSTYLQHNLHHNSCNRRCMAARAERAAPSLDSRVSPPSRKRGMLATPKAWTGVESLQPLFPRLRSILDGRPPLPRVAVTFKRAVAENQSYEEFRIISAFLLFLLQMVLRSILKPHEPAWGVERDIHPCHTHRSSLPSRSSILRMKYSCHALIHYLFLTWSLAPIGKN